MNIKFMIILLFFTFISNSFAEDRAQKRKCEYSETINESYKTEYKELQKLSKSFGIELCKSYLFVLEEEVESFDNTLANYAKAAKEKIQVDFPDTTFKGINKISEMWEEQLLNYRENFDYLTVIKIDGLSDFDEGDHLIVELPTNSTEKLAIALSSEEEKICKKVSNNKSCFEIIENLNSAIKPAFTLLNGDILQNNRLKLINLQGEWKQFIKDARYQTPLDVWATTTFQSNYFNGSDLVGPPEWQVFLLRPSIVFEHVNGLEKGNRDDASLALEWVGFNLWKKGVGVSLTSIYNDRKEADSVGHGLTFHINNKYSFGYVHRSNDNGSFFFNIDLLELFGDNKGVYKNYKEYF